MLKLAKVIGLNSDQEVALTLVCYQPDQPDNIAFFALVTAGLDDAFTKVRQALFEAENLFYSSTDSITTRLTDVSSVILGNLSEANTLGFLLAASKFDEQNGRVFYFLNHGNSTEAYLWRKDKLTNLAETNLADQIISGFLTPGDRVVISSLTIKDLLGDNFKLLFSLPTENLEDEILARLPAGNIDPTAAIILQEEAATLEKESILPAEKTIPFWSGLAFRLPKPEVKQIIYQKKKLITILVLVLIVGLAGFMTAKKIIFRPPTPAPAPKTENQTANISNLYQLKELPVWLDLDLIKKGFQAQSLSLSIDRILLLDKDSKTLVSVDLKNKSYQILAGEEKLGGATLASLNGDLASVYSADKGIMTVDLGSSQLNNPIKTDPQWGEIADLYSFAGNIYLLESSSSGRVWKYVPIVSGYAEKKNYLKDGVKVDLQDVLRMQIDSSVWVLKQGGQVLKFTQGVADHFSLGGLDKPVHSPRSFFVADKTESLYLLDNGNKRLLVLDKSGSYQSQYLADLLGEVSDLVVDEVNKKAYLLDKSKIYLLELN